MELWIPENAAQDMLRRAKQPDEEGLIYSAALESVLREYGVGTAELELARDDAGWMKLAIGESSGISDMNRTYAVRRARAYFARDPLSGQAVRIWTDYALGQGISWKAKDDNVGELLRKFWDDKANEPILSSGGQRKSSDKLLVDGELFFIFFEAAGKVKIRRIDPLEITEIITDPDDVETKLLYKREWTNIQNQTYSRYYRDWSNDNKDGSWPDMYGSMKSATAESGIIYHVPFRTLGVRGVSLLFSAMDWSKAHRKFLEARASITQAMARFAWKAKLKGTPAQVSAEKTRLQSSYVGGAGEENNPPLAPGSTWIENEGYTLSPIKVESGAAAAQVDANMLLQLFGTAVGIFPHYFGAGEAFRLATATAMERPMRVQFEAYQKLWADIYDNIFEFVLNKNRVPSNKQYVDIDFPPIVEKDANEKIKVILEVIEKVPELDGDEMRKLILTTLGVNDPDEVLNNMEPIEKASGKLVKALQLVRNELKEDKSNGHKEVSVL